MPLRNVSADSQGYQARVDIGKRNVTEMNRRNFIHNVVLAGGGLMLAIPAFATKPDGEDTLQPGDAVLGDLLTIMPYVQAVFSIHQHEMGQGVATAMAMIPWQKSFAPTGSG